MRSALANYDTVYRAKLFLVQNLLTCVRGALQTMNIVFVSTHKVHLLSVSVFAL